MEEVTELPKKVGRPKKVSIEDGTWFRIVQGKDERGNSFHHQVEVVTVKDGSVDKIVRSEKRGFINLEPILLKAMVNQYKKGQLLDSRFHEVKKESN